MKKSVLIINMCKEKLNFFEFVKPIANIVKEETNFFIRNYKSLSHKDLKKASKVILCGTAIKDDEYLKHLYKFDWIKNFNKPVLGICAGMQVIGLIYNGKLKGGCEIGFYEEKFRKEFLGIKGNQKVYHLHKNYVSFNKQFENFTTNKVPQAVKHKDKDIYGVLFHPEVRQKNLIKYFVNL